jgi:hypothetical protein
MSAEGLYWYFKRPADIEHREVMILQICKERSTYQKVHALLLEEHQEGLFVRIGIARLANYNLYKFIPSHPRGGIRWGFHWNPREEDCDMDERIETEE